MHRVLGTRGLCGCVYEVVHGRVVSQISVHWHISAWPFMFESEIVPSTPGFVLGSFPPLAALCSKPHSPGACPLCTHSHLSFHQAFAQRPLYMADPTSLSGRVPIIPHCPSFSTPPPQIHHFLPGIVMTFVSIRTIAQ